MAKAYPGLQVHVGAALVVASVRLRRDYGRRLGLQGVWTRRGAKEGDIRKERQESVRKASETVSVARLSPSSSGKSPFDLATVSHFIGPPNRVPGARRPIAPLELSPRAGRGYSAGESP
jgi:hypothetical protein